MATAKQLPSGSWRVQVSTGVKNENGRYIYESFTAPTKKEAEYMALEYELKRKKEKRSPQKITLREACKKYTDNKSNVLSPTTVSSYHSMTKHRMAGIMNLPIEKLTNDIIQTEINADAKTHSPKSVRNVNGFLSAVLREFRPDFALRTTLPQKVKHMPRILQSEEIGTIVGAVRGSDIEVPVLLALLLGLRISEVRGLKFNCVDFDKKTITIKEVKLDAENGSETKTPKSYAGTRVIPAPQYLIDRIAKLPRDGEYVTSLTWKQLYYRFQKILSASGLPHMRFHDLRHANASVMLALNIPNKYAMKRIGHATDDMLKRVYQHTMDKEEIEMHDKITSYFEGILDHEK